jgi:acyl-CoA reductase-like NAD-dependent aldehyde dehydrogenase
MDDHAHLIDGRLVPGRRFFDIVDPSTGEAFARCPDAIAEDLDAAMDAASRAFADATWTADEAGRRAVLVRIADALVAHADDLARLLAREQGKPLAQATGEVRGAAELLRIHAREEIPVDILRDDERVRVTVVRRPLGPTAAITPWNYPIATLVGKLAPALLAGNTVVAKPNHHMSTGALAPFGGMKWSGIGRENGRWGIEEFCDVQVLSTRFAPDAS